jgi:hypothetical protein
MARVTMPIKDRSMFLHFLYANNLVEVNINPTSTHKKLLYIDDNNDDIGLVLTENHYKELAFTYLNWKNKGGYKECRKCGRLFRVKTGPMKKKVSGSNEKTDRAQLCWDCTEEYEAKYRDGFLDRGVDVVVVEIEGNVLIIRSEE